MRSKELEQKIVVPIFDDPFYIECIRLAGFSKGTNQRYGSLLVKNGVVLGRGYNRAIAHPSFGKLKRMIYQGYSNHAEIEALNDALMRGCDVQNAEIFVGGYFPKENGLLFLHNEFTCLRCPPILTSFAISKINVPTPQGWLPRSLNEAMIEAKAYTSGGTYKNRVLSVPERWTVMDLSTA